MSEQQHFSKAYVRIIELVEMGLTNNPNSLETGKWKAADKDEIETLTVICSEELPSKFIKLVEAGNFGGDEMDQWNFANRLQRAIQVHTKFGAPQKFKANGELLTFHLNQPDRDRVIELCSKMRKIILASPIFDAAHKRRLLNRINAIEKQVHQEQGLMDVVLGGVSDVGDTLKKFGTDLKPLTDRMSEIKRITQSNSAEYDQIPSPEELEALPPPEDTE